MRTRFVSLLRLSALVAVLFAGGSVLAADDPGKEPGKSKIDGLLGLIGAVNGLEIPDLAGLIQPEKMGMLTDNQSSIRGNEARFFSDNEGEFALLSGNHFKILSGIRLFSGITVHVDVSVHAGNAKRSKAKKDDGRRDAKKSKERKSPRKTKRL